MYTFLSAGFFKAIEQKNYIGIDRFLREGVDINKPNERHLTPLMLAIQCGDASMVQHLIRNGADTNQVISSYKPIHYLALGLMNFKKPKSSKFYIVMKKLINDNIFQLSPLEQQLVAFVMKEKSLDTIQAVPTQIALKLYQFNLLDEALRYLLDNLPQVDIDMAGDEEITVGHFIISTEGHYQILLSQFPDLLMQKLVASLRAQSQAKVIREGTTFFALLGKDSGYGIIDGNLYLQTKITETMMAVPIEEGHYKGISATLSLCTSEKGIDLLINNPLLRNMISTRGLSVVYKNTYPVLCLFGSNKARDLLIKDSLLRSKLTPNLLLSCYEPGKTVLSSLEGQVLSSNYTTLLNLLKPAIAYTSLFNPSNAKDRLKRRSPDKNYIHDEQQHDNASQFQYLT